MRKYINKFLFSVLFLIFSCSKDISQYGKVTPYESAAQKTFIFSVDERYIKANKKSKPHPQHKNMTKAEVKLLERLLHRQNLCINDYHNPVFQITSKQEKIYDVTFAGLIQENYNARPIVPRRYYGKCTNKYNPLEADTRNW